MHFCYTIFFSFAPRWNSLTLKSSTLSFSNFTTFCRCKIQSSVKFIIFYLFTKSTLQWTLNPMWFLQNCVVVEINCFVWKMTLFANAYKHRANEMYKQLDNRTDKTQHNKTHRHVRCVTLPTSECFGTATPSNSNGAFSKRRSFFWLDFDCGGEHLCVRCSSYIVPAPHHTHTDALGLGGWVYVCGSVYVSV